MTDTNEKRRRRARRTAVDPALDTQPDAGSDLASDEDYEAMVRIAAASRAALAQDARERRLLDEGKAQGQRRNMGWPHE